MISNELQIGKAGEHLACCDLIMQGHNAFLADQGLPFDVVVEEKGILKKVQVKTTTKLISCKGRAQNVYRFGLRRGCQMKDRMKPVDCDYYAFVALDIKSVAYIPKEKMVARTGKIKQVMDFKSRNIKYKGRIYSNGTIRKPEWGKYLQDFNKFNL